MQIKSFIAGIFAGVVLTLAAFQFLIQEDPETENTPSRPTVDNTTSESAATIELDRRVTLQNERSAQQGFGGVDSPTEEIEDRDGDNYAVETQPTLQSDSRRNQVPVTEAHKQLLDQYANADPESTAPTNSRRELESEPRDHEWSYFMEQAIAQYLASHPEIQYFDIAGIQCRATICEIQSFGVDENAGPRWGLVVHDLRNQPWNDFGQTGSTSDTFDGRLVMFTYLHRLSEDE